MTKEKYNRIRAIFIIVFGVFMLFSGVMLLYIGITEPGNLKEQCTEYVMGEVVKVDGSDLKIYYELPAEGETWYVSRTGSGYKEGDEVRVFYDPDNFVTYIEGFDEGIVPEDIIIGLVGVGVGIAALLMGWTAKKGGRVNKIIDAADSMIE